MYCTSALRWFLWGCRLCGPRAGDRDPQWTGRCGARDEVDVLHIPIRNSQAIAERIAWMRDHPEERLAKGCAAHERALTFTWQRYRAGVADYLGPI